MFRNFTQSSVLSLQISITQSLTLRLKIPTIKSTNKSQGYCIHKKEANMIANCLFSFIEIQNDFETLSY